MPVSNERIVTPPAFTGGIENATLKWRSIFAGALLSLLTYLILAGLGLAIGGSVLSGVTEGESASGLGIGSAIWLVVSLVVSLFVGSYLASRVSGMITTHVGGIQGLVVAALFFAFMFWQVSAGISTLTGGLGSAVGFLGGAAGDISQNPQVQSVIQDSLGDLNLRSSPETVAKGIATRLIQGNPEGAKNYLANQAGISQAQADARIEEFRSDFEQTMTDVAQGAIQGVTIAGWTIFGALLLGSLSALFGGSAGARRTLKHPVSDKDREVITETPQPRTRAAG